jgi:hypothetical protein
MLAMKIPVYEDENGNGSLHDLPSSREVFAELADGFGEGRIQK